MWNKITDIIDAEEIHIIYDGYLKNYLKEHERLRRTVEVEPIEYPNLSRQSPKPEQLERFGPVQLKRSTYTVSPGCSLLRSSKTAGSEAYVVVAILRMIGYKTVKCFVKKHIHSNLK